MREIEYRIGDYILELEAADSENGNTENRELAVIGYRGYGSAIRIPESIKYCGERLFITCIGKKAFLGNGSIRQFTLSSAIRRIEDWAFAQCDKLSMVVIEGKDKEKMASADADEDKNKIMSVDFGKGVFMDCGRLNDICLGYSEKDSLSALLAAALCHFDDEYLLHDKDIGTQEWYRKWDSRLDAYISEKDSKGYTNLVLCGEEDIQKSKTGYVSDRRKQKAKLCMLRLMNNDYLDDVHYDGYREYLLRYCKGGESDETWRMVLDDYGDNLDYYRMLAEIGGITADNIDDMLIDMGENHAEAKAFLIGFKNERFGSSDVFESFEL